MNVLTHERAAIVARTQSKLLTGAIRKYSLHFVSKIVLTQIGDTKSCSRKLFNYFFVY
ncbi:hypothetical protein H1P_1350011 [Hyella patelloides LEGE 07179]|uniref:Uncharacterized protein n=1 Tax=Hyella patelloides LEGE 07179 TaxID=945734 RepID=A0A563VKY9_9CYAN|nr:hypothetical protein H1P_1350011 [Hyella patelloides LEGE 07179]